MRDMGILLLCYLVAALLVGSIGICCSAVFRKTTTATVASYGILGIMVLGTYLVNQLVLYLHQWGGEAWMASAGQEQAAENSGNFLYLLLVNPTTTFFLTILRMAGQEQEGNFLVQMFGNRYLESIHDVWVGGSVVIQVALAGVFLWMAVRALDRGRW